jgi:hypothetical protein
VTQNFPESYLCTVCVYNELGRICSLRYFRRTQNGSHTFAHNYPDASVVDRDSFDADPDRNFHFDVDPDRHQNDANPHADPTPKFYTC